VTTVTPAMMVADTGSEQEATGTVGLVVHTPVAIVVVGPPHRTWRP
jgi:hypothetical protein